MILDMLESILRYSDHPRHMGPYLTRQVRELVGGRIVVLAQCHSTGGEDVCSLVSITPERYRDWDKAEALAELVRFSHNLNGATLWETTGAPPPVLALLSEMECNAVIIIPLRVGLNRVGALFVLHLLDMLHGPYGRRRAGCALALWHKRCDRRPPVNGRSDAGNERKGVEEQDRSRKTWDQSAFHVRIHGKLHRPPRSAGRRGGLHPKTFQHERPGQKVHEVMKGG